MANIVIIGAGIGGVPAAYELRHKLDKSHSITIVNPVDYFQFVPSNPWLAVGWRKRPDIIVPIAPILQKRGIQFRSHTVTLINPKQQSVTLDNQEVLPYDHLIICTGPKLAFDEVPGAGPEHFTESVCTVAHAEHAYTAYLKFLEDPGPVVIGALPGASCFGPAYEFAFIVDTDLRKRKMRNKVPITFVTSEPYIGHLGLGGVGDSKTLLEHEFRQRDIQWITSARTTHIEEGKLFCEEINRKGEIEFKHELPFKFSMMLPAFLGVDAVANVEGLCNPRGFVLIDPYQRSPAYPNIHAAGVCVAIPPVEKTPVATGIPKTGYMIESMVSAIVENIAAELAGKPPAARGTWNAICLADMGNTGAAFVALPEIPPRNTNWSAQGKWVHLAKIAFEKYFLFKIRNGTSEPMYEKYILKALGIVRLMGSPHGHKTSPDA